MLTQDLSQIDIDLSAAQGDDLPVGAPPKQASNGRGTGLIANVLLLEPVSMGLQERNLTWLTIFFIVHRPRRSSIFSNTLFAPTELNISHVLHRHFWWYKCALAR